MTQEAALRTFARVVGWIALILGLGLLALAVTSWPPQGLFFAASYFFGFPGLFFFLLGAALLWIGRTQPGSGSGPPAS